MYGVYKLGKQIFKAKPDLINSLLNTQSPDQHRIDELHDELVTGLDTDFDRSFSNGQEFFTLYEGAWTFKHVRR